MASARPPQRTSVFIDSSVLIAAAISPTGAGRELILRGLRGEVQLWISPLVLQETERNLRAKAPAAMPAFMIFAESLAAIQISPTRAAVLRAAQLIAIKDAPIVAAARRAKAEYLATYDRKDLLSQREPILTHFGVQTVLPDEILKLFA